jgi:hypothetical protein
MTSSTACSIKTRSSALESLQAHTAELINFFYHLHVLNAPRTVHLILIACLRASHVIRRINSVTYPRGVNELSVQK